MGWGHKPIAGHHRISITNGGTAGQQYVLYHGDISIPCDPDHQQNICSYDDMKGIQNTSLLVISVTKTILMIRKLVMAVTHKNNKYTIA